MLPAPVAVTADKILLLACAKAFELKVECTILSYCQLRYDLELEAGTLSRGVVSITGSRAQPGV